MNSDKKDVIEEANEIRKKKNRNIIADSKMEYQKKNNCFVEFDEDWIKICNLALNKLRDKKK